MEHILWALIVTIVTMTAQGPQLRHESHSTFIREASCHEMKLKKIDEVGGVLPRGVFVDCVPIKHQMIW
jgi:hypothetical protein